MPFVIQFWLMYLQDEAVDADELCMSLSSFEK